VPPEAIDGDTVVPLQAAPVLLGELDGTIDPLREGLDGLYPLIGPVL
jgi:hypothetical protein